jgi:CubicO group peptidase (beta-lactamase class C family)
LLSLLFSAFTLGNAAPAPAAGDGLPVKAPVSVGMSAARLEKIDHVIQRGISAGGYPGAAVVVGRRGAAVWERGFGRVSWRSDAAPVVAERTIYDLASLTKVVGTTTAMMILFDEGKIRLDDPVSKYIPQFSGGNKDRVTVRMLLEHRSGLPAGRDLWRITRSPAEAREAIITTPLAFKPNQYVEYSDLGADMLGFIVEAASGQSLDAFLRDRVFTPLAMDDTDFRPALSLRDRIAPTEINPPRGYPIRGEVHDENAFALGGVAGHAGLFSTAADLSVFAQMMLNGGVYAGTRIVADSTVTIFTKRAAGTRALGWDTCGGSGSCGKHLGDKAYGHTGFTGTSLWIDPEREMFVVLLTNRVHDARARRPATVIADVRADLSDAAALAVTDDPDGVLAMPSAFRADKAVGWNKPVAKKRPVRKPSSSAKKAVVSVQKPTTSTKATAGKSTTTSSTTRKPTTTPAKPTTSSGSAGKKPATTTAKPPTKTTSTTAKKPGG